MSTASAFCPRADVDERTKTREQMSIWHYLCDQRCSHLTCIHLVVSLRMTCDVMFAACFRPCYGNIRGSRDRRRDLHV